MKRQLTITELYSLTSFRSFGYWLNFIYGPKACPMPYITKALKTCVIDDKDTRLGIEIKNIFAKEHKEREKKQLN